MLVMQEVYGEMLLIRNSFDEFRYTAGRKKIIAFGASEFLKLISLNYRELELGRCIDCVADNDGKKQGGSILIDGYEKTIISPGRIIEYGESQAAVLISSDVYAYEIYCQLEEMLEGKDMEIFVLSLMISEHTDEISDVNAMVARERNGTIIPKIIHYFWFSGEKKTEMAKRCIESWERACPDYELMEWNADNYDVSRNAFAHEAYMQKKWAYVTDYARLDTVFMHGGVYLDLDVVLHKSIDALMGHDFFIGFGPVRDIEAAAFGATPGCKIVGEMRGIYKNMSFDPERSMGLLQLQPVLLDRFFEKKGFSINGRYQEKDGIAIYPRDIFSARNWFTGEYEFTEASLGIHECAGGWTGNDVKSIKQIRAEGTKKLMEIYRGQRGTWEAKTKKQPYSAREHTGSKP